MVFKDRYVYMPTIWGFLSRLPPNGSHITVLTFLKDLAVFHVKVLA